MCGRCHTSPVISPRFVLAVPGKEYPMTLDMAKELAMLGYNEKVKQAQSTSLNVSE
jgi:phage anti-repressor protein